jgi:hypothetical protein
MGIDVQQQWRELEETYSNMADEESSLWPRKHMS